MEKKNDMSTIIQGNNFIMYNNINNNLLTEDKFRDDDLECFENNDNMLKS